MGDKPDTWIVKKRSEIIEEELADIADNTSYKIQPFFWNNEK